MVARASRESDFESRRPRVASAALRELASSIPAECYHRPVLRGLLYLARDLLLYVAAIAALVLTESPWLRAPLWLVAGGAVSALFVIGHDAAHGALFDSARLGRLVGRLTLLPSLHAYEVWAYGHNRLHHGHTGCAEIDFVWNPSTREQLEAQPPWVRMLHRVEWSAWGAGLYYARNVWWARMVRGDCPPRLTREFRNDRLLVCAFVVCATLGFTAVGWFRYETFAAALWLPIEVLLIPWMVFLQIIGVVVYLHHIGPETVWLERAQWNKVRGRIDGTNTWCAPLLDFLWHNIFCHVPHHVDPRIPFYNLPRASAALAARLDGAQPAKLRLRDYLRVAKRCKLYDFERGCWTDYQGRRATPELSRAGHGFAAGSRRLVETNP